MIKRTLILIGLILIPIYSMGQFILEPGHFTTEDKKGYIVIEHKGSKSELYDKIKTCITSYYVSAKDVISEIKPDLITLHGVTSGIYFKHSGLDCCPCIHYKINIYFKDDKIRFNAPDIIGEINDEFSMGYYIIIAKKANMFDTGIRMFKKDGTPRIPKGIEAIEQYFNNLVSQLVDNMDNKGIPKDENW